MDGGCPALPARRVDAWPAFTCNSHNRDSEWAIFGAAAKHNKQIGRPKKFFGSKYSLFYRSFSQQPLFSV